MEKIRKYVERFFKTHKKNSQYGLYSEEVFSCAKMAENDVSGAIITAFDYGYAKGYRAAMAEMKKKGGAAV